MMRSMFATVMVVMLMVALTVTAHAQTAAAGAAYVALTDAQQVVLLDREGQVVAQRELTGTAGGMEGRKLLGVAVGDVASSSPGAEMIVLRSDGYVELYPDPTRGTGALNRLGYYSLSKHGGRVPVAIDLADVLHDHPGTELIVLARGTPTEDMPHVEYVHYHDTGAMDGASSGEARRVAQGYTMLDEPGMHEPYAAITAGDLVAAARGLELVVVTAVDSDTRRGWMEAFALEHRRQEWLAQRQFDTAFRGSSTVMPVAVTTEPGHVVTLGRDAQGWRIDRFAFDGATTPAYASTVRLPRTLTDAVTLVDLDALTRY